MNPSQRIDQLIAGITDWRSKTFAGIRTSILEADPEIIEEWKWMGSPVWSRDELVDAVRGRVVHDRPPATRSSCAKNFGQPYWAPR